MARVGLIQGLVVGIAALVISVIIAFIIVQQVSTVHEEIEVADWAGVVTNETGRVNNVAYTLDDADVAGFISPVITALWNATTAGEGSYNLSVPVGNATVTSAGVVTNATTFLWEDMYISYTYTYKGQSSAVERLQSNFSEGIEEVADKIPTVLLIAAVVLILGVLVLLWTQYKKMNIGGDGSEL